jgi:hypothetical protein
MVAIPDKSDPPPPVEHIISGMLPWTAARQPIAAKVGAAASDSQPAALALRIMWPNSLTTPRDS